MGALDWIESWPVYRQLTGADKTGRGAAAKSRRTRDLTPRIAVADKVVKSICPYCAVGCGQRVYVQRREGHPDRGRPGLAHQPRQAVPQGSGEPAAHDRAARQTRCCYRRPYGTEWEHLDLDTAMEMVADRVIARAASWQEWEPGGAGSAARMGIAHLGGATLDNEENYLIKKLFTALGAIQIENQARI